ncbi:hypothetical protein QUB63_15610 [Microcoleus sp. ARI1-B5]|uniref:hypothetical protein n=1 Tax=unclassified Microcoleus TaxID=2642155 RepID=UPI002FD5B719
MTDRPLQAVEFLTMPLHESSAFPENLPEPKLLPAVEVDEMLTKIQRSHAYYYKVMNLEVWALVETLDGLFPGAWGQFMTNRQVAVKQFLQRDREPNYGVDPHHSATDAQIIGSEEEGRRKKEDGSQMKEDLSSSVAEGSPRDEG